MESIASWSHKWFGWWREDGFKPAHNFPSITDFVDADWQYAELSDIREYLLMSPVFFRIGSYRCCIHGRGHDFVRSIRTDGEWLWCDDLYHYVADHDVKIPIPFLLHMQARQFEVLPYWDTTVKEVEFQLEWPLRPEFLFNSYQRRGKDHLRIRSDLPS